jgi:phosphatidylglycerophosphate synthase
MLDDALRGFKDRLLAPAARALGPGVHPHLITLLALMLGGAVFVLCLRQAYGWALLAWVGNRFLDGLDGVTARVHGTQSDLGGYLDLVLDFLVYALVPLGLVLSRPASELLYLTLAVMLATFYVNAASWTVLSAILEKRNRGARERAEQTTVSMPAGIVGGTETMVFYGLFLLFPDRLIPLFTVLALLVGLSTLQRIVWAVRYL